MNAPAPIRTDSEPGRLWSLWEMINFDVGALIGAQNMLGTFCQMIIESKNAGRTIAIIDTQYDGLMDACKIIEANANKIGLEVSVVAARDLLKQFSERQRPESGLPIVLNAVDFACLEMRAKYLIASLRDGMALKKEFILQTRSVYYYEQTSPLFGEEVENCFPSASLDISEAGKCLAFSRWTASVMHLMRVLESGINALAIHVEVNPKENWNSLLNDIEAKIRTIGKNESGKIDEKFAAEAATHLRFIKNAWRNYAMHAHETYDEERAFAIYENVKSFMRHLSTRLSE